MRLKMSVEGNRVEVRRAVDAHFTILWPKPGVQVRMTDYLSFVRLTKRDVERLHSSPELQNAHELLMPFHIDHLNDPIWCWESIYRAMNYPESRINNLLKRADAFLSKLPRQEPVKVGSDEHTRLFGNFAGDPKETAALLTLAEYEDLVGLMNTTHHNLPRLLETLDSIDALPAFSRNIITGRSGWVIRLAPTVSLGQLLLKESVYPYWSG